MSWIPHITVAAVVERDGRYLLVEELVDDQRVINQPAGHLEANETLIDAVIRETLEETAWHFQPSNLIGIYEWQHPVKCDTYIRFCFTGELLEQDPQATLDPDIEQTLWLSYEDIQHRQLNLRSPLVLSCINDYRAGRLIDINLINTVK